MSGGVWVDLAGELAREYRLGRPIQVLQSDHASLLATWGFFRPSIIVPAGADSWTPDRIRVVLSHELAHVRRGDWIVQLGAELLRSFYWFNPLTWIVCRQLRLDSEQACDDVVVSSGMPGADYANHLLELARSFNRRRTWIPAPAMARPSSLQRRIAAMLNDRLDRRPVSIFIRFATSLALVALTAVIAGAQPFATVAGSLVDPSGAVLPGARVLLASAERQTKYEVLSDRTGRFEFDGLRPGDYVLEVAVPGFMGVREALTVPSEGLDRRIVLQLGRLQETITVRESSSVVAPLAALPPRPIPPCPPNEPGSTPVGGNIRPPAKLRDVRPIFPAALRGMEGVVVLDSLIGLDGFIKEVSVKESPSPAFSNAVLEAVRQWQFDSTLLNCTPVEVSMTITARFVPDK